MSFAVLLKMKKVEKGFFLICGRDCRLIHIWHILCEKSISTMSFKFIALATKRETQKSGHRDIIIKIILLKELKLENKNK